MINYIASASVDTLCERSLCRKIWKRRHKKGKGLEVGISEVQ